MNRIQTKDTSLRSPKQGDHTSQQMVLCTICPHKGTACQEGFALMARLQKSIEAAGSSLAPDFEISGYAELTGCDRRCLLAYHGTKDETYLFGDVEKDADIPALVDYAQTHQVPLNRGDTPPVPARLTQSPASIMAMGHGALAL